MCLQAPVHACHSETCRFERDAVTMQDHLRSPLAICPSQCWRRLNPAAPLLVG